MRTAAAEVDQFNRRGIYYQNPDLFGSQQYVDKLVDDIAFTFGLGRDTLNIVSYIKPASSALYLTIFVGCDGQGAHCRRCQCQDR
jgi:hypothetical protein